MIVSLYASLLTILLIGLSVNVIRIRKQKHIGLGDAGINALQRAIRAQANMIEYTPIFLILLGLAEQNGLNVYCLHICGLVYLLGRLLHAFALLKKERYENLRLVAGFEYRIIGMMCTFSTLAALSLTLLVQILFK